MTYNDGKFTVTKGMENTFVISIKEDDNVTPVVLIEGTDTFVVKLSLLGDSSVVSGPTAVIEDAANGKIKIIIPQIVADALIFELGDKSDRYYIRPTYKLTLICNTQANGSFVSTIPLIYVQE